MDPTCRNAPFSGWHFEETLSFLETAGALAFALFKAQIHPLIVRLWAHLRKYALHFLQYLPGQHTVTQIREAQNELYCFAVLAERHLQGQLLTLLLHRAVVHIPEQAIALGPTAFHS